jgi:hypothetical protein
MLTVFERSFAPASFEKSVDHAPSMLWHRVDGFHEIVYEPSWSI